MARRRKKPLYEVIGNEAINELITIGLSFLIIVFGVNYFNFKYAWVGIIQTIGEQSGISQSEFSNEIGLMFSSLAQSFPLKYLFGEYNIMQAALIGLIILAIGLTLKFLLKTSRERFIADIGRDISVPAIIGLISLITIQIILGITAQQSYTEFTNQLDSNLFIWQTFGQLIIVGINALIIGSIIKLVAKKQKSIKLRAFGNILVNGAYICIVYYLVLRLLSLKILLDSQAGGFFKIFLLSGDVTAYILLFCIFMFTTGLAINRYGRYLLLKKRHHREQRARESGLPLPRQPYTFRNH